MPFTKIDYNSSDEVFEVKIMDNTGAVIDRWKFQKKDFPKFTNIICKKYGIDLKRKVPSDLDWTNY